MITVNGVEISLEFLPELVDALDHALIIDKRQHVLRVERDGKDIRITDLTEHGFSNQAWNYKDLALPHVPPEIVTKGGRA